MVIAVVICIVLGILACYAMMMNVEKRGHDKIISLECVTDDVDAIIVLGAGVKSDGMPCDMLIDRLKIAIEVYNKAPNAKILLSGDHGSKTYNEVKAMKKYVMENSDIDESDIFLDHAGFSTYDTMYRAESIFKVESAIVITNKYHLPRALYIGNSRGIEVYGISSDIRNYMNIDSYKTREKLAQMKDFLYVNIFKPEPTYLGEEIPINSSDGRITDDEL